MRFFVLIQFSIDNRYMPNPSHYKRFTSRALVELVACTDHEFPSQGDLVLIIYSDGDHLSYLN